MFDSLENLAENATEAMAHLETWFLFYLCNTEDSLSTDQRSNMLMNYQNLQNTITQAIKEVSHV